jgi:hypothetical protein
MFVTIKTHKKLFKRTRNQRAFYQLSLCAPLNSGIMRPCKVRQEYLQKENNDKEGLRESHYQLA